MASAEMMMSGCARVGTEALAQHVPIIGALAEQAYALAEKRLAAAGLVPELEAYLSDYCRAVDSARRRLQVGRIPACSGTFLAALMAAGKAPDALDLEMAAGWELFKLALCLFDAVEDKELSPAFMRWGEGVAVNGALVLFVLANDAIFAACERLPPERRSRFRHRYTAYAIHVGSAQHRDLRNWSAPNEEVAVEQARGKCTLYMMLLELAAIVAGCDEGTCARYRSVGEGLALLFQISNDLRDLFGVRSAADLVSGRWSLPVHVFHARASAEESDHFRKLVGELPAALTAVQRLFVSSGTITRLGELMDRARARVHEAIAALGGSDGPLELVAEIADGHADRMRALRLRAQQAAADGVGVGGDGVASSPSAR